MRLSHRLLCVASTWTIIVVVLFVIMSKLIHGPHVGMSQAYYSGLSDSQARGCMVALRYYEQQTQAINNLLKLQCFASTYGMNVLEPFIEGSKFTTRISEIVKGQSFLKFGDLFNSDNWNKQVAEYGYPKLAKWSDFLKNGPKKVIVACIRYRNKPMKPSVPGFNFRHGCKTECYEKMNDTVEALSVYGFEVVRSVCANFVEYSGAVTTESFMQNALGEYSPGEVTIMMNDFRGFFGLYRLPVLSNCGIIHHEQNPSVIPSQRIFADAERYQAQYLEGKPHVAIIARVERVVLHLNHDIAKCSNAVTHVLRKVESRRNSPKKRFLGMDVGKFGSGGAKRLQPAGEVLFNSVYKDKWSFEEWEQTFEGFASANNSAYIANLQRTIASQADCLIMFGGGSFQELAKRAYEANHPNGSTQCIFRICTSEDGIFQY